MIKYSELKVLSKKGNVIPIFKRVPSDLETPVSVYMKLASKKKQSFLLESIEGGEKLARFSFIGFDPFLSVEGDGQSIVVSREKNKRKFDVAATEMLTELFSVYKPVKIEGLPRFTGGGVGYFSYDTIRWVENIPDNNRDEINFPEMVISLYANIIAFDHLKQEMIIISNILHEDGQGSLKTKYDDAVGHIESVIKKLQRPIPKQTLIKSNRNSKIKSLTSQVDYEKAVRRAKKYIKEGDIFQVVLSQRWQVDTNRSALEVYRRLRRINPSPYMFLLNYGDDAVVGASPEMMVRIEDGVIETRPIAGTRPRGKTEAEDKKQIENLLADEKEIAEHTMLLDLGRNDVGRVSKAGSVQVRDNMIIEKYSHVIHIVSSVVGEIMPKKTILDGLFACMPAGTVSGAPKIRAMEIIDELEDLKRGVYAGAVAYLDFWGNLDSCITIRTVVKKGASCFVQAGAGIVADSKPTREYKECEAKARALIEAVAGADDQ